MMTANRVVNMVMALLTVVACVLAAVVARA